MAANRITRDHWQDAARWLKITHEPEGPERPAERTFDTGGARALVPFRRGPLRPPALPCGSSGRQSAHVTPQGSPGRREHAPSCRHRVAVAGKSGHHGCASRDRDGRRAGLHREIASPGDHHHPDHRHVAEWKERTVTPDGCGVIVHRRRVLPSLTALSEGRPLRHRQGLTMQPASCAAATPGSGRQSSISAAMTMIPSARRWLRRCC